MNIHLQYFERQKMARNYNVFKNEQFTFFANQAGNDTHFRVIILILERKQLKCMYNSL